MTQPQELTTAQKWDVIENICNIKLKDCDWTQLPDSGITLSGQIVWDEYRLALMELVDRAQDPDAVIYPTEPEGERP